MHYSGKAARGKPRQRRWDTVQIVLLPLDFKFGHYPYLRKMRILADRSGLRYPRASAVPENSSPAERA